MKIPIRIMYCGYREWALEILRDLRALFPTMVDFQHVDTKEGVALINPNVYDLMLFVGWSWIIKQELIETNKCVCLHPSPLPLYRGGSPLQNQIIAGETESAVTLFIMDKGIDTGPLLLSEPFSLQGDLDDVLMSMLEAGETAIINLLLSTIYNGQIPKGIPQDESKATSFKRRKPAQSEITCADIAQSTALQLHNKIRSLQDPYPNAFITCQDGEKLYITKSKLCES